MFGWYSLMFAHLYEIVRARAVRFPDAIAVGGQQGLGWKTVASRVLLDLIDRLADELRDTWTIAPGDRVVLWIPNSWRAPVYLFALWKLGAIVVPFDREMNPSAAASIIDSVEPRWILGGYGTRPGWASESDRFVEWWEPLAGRVERADAHSAWSVPAEDLAAIFFTSGTTGQPKGCMITHANLCFEVDALRNCIPLDPTCRLASILPLSHLFELTCGLLYPLAMGAAIHYVPSRRGPDLVRVLREQRVTHMIAVPQLLTMMSQALDGRLRDRLPTPLYRGLTALADRLPLEARRNLFFMVHRQIGGQLRVIASGGAALAPEIHHQWERIGVSIVQGYGTSECSPVVAAGIPGATPVGSVGRPLPGVEVRLSAEGELIARGPNVMRGYWQDPERTAEVLRDGWYATGDQARIDADGNVWILGRLKDLIVLPSGLNVWPQDVEDVLRSHPAVKDAAVVLVPTPSGGANLHAYLIPFVPAVAEGAQPDASGVPSAPAAPDGEGSPSALDLTRIVAWANGRLAQHQRVATASWWVSETGDFPRTSTLKVRRHLLPAPDRAATIKVASALAADDPVGQAVAAASHLPHVEDQQTLGELGLDSLGLVELALLIEEKTGHAVDDGDLSLDMTVAQVRSALATDPVASTDAVAKPSQRERDWEMPLWPYTWGHAFRVLSLPFDLLYRAAVTQTIVLGDEYLADLPPRVIFAGTHRSYGDLLLLRMALSRTGARRFARKLVVAASSVRYGQAGILGSYATLAFGLYPLQQHHGRAASLRGLAQLAMLGNATLIFPQGKHTSPSRERAGDPIARFRPGVAQLAAALDAVVVPFGLAGTERIVPPEPPPGFEGPVIAGIPVLVNRGPLAICFGAAIRPGDGEDQRAFTERLERICFDLARRSEHALPR